MEQIMEYVKPELLAIIPVLYFVGTGLKKAAFVPDKYIPLWIGLCGVVLSSLWVLATCTIGNWQDGLKAVFVALVQGVLCAGCSVYVNQIGKQVNKTEKNEGGQDDV